jgi:ATP-dependent Lon protease
VVPVEVALFKGKGKVTLTGSLGDVMKESAQIAHSYLKSIAADWGIDPGRVEETDVHIHCPEGAMPKDGPSAGITMITALLSAFLDKPTISGLAMTGEITLSGRVLPIGGLKEKILGAYRNQRTIVFFPEENRRNINELPEDVMEKIKVIFSGDVNQALRWFFGKDQLPE